jgi:AAA ATPase-like protein
VIGRRPSLSLPRTPLVDALCSAAAGPTPLLVTGPPGAGKTTLLHVVAARLREQGWTAVYLDLMGAASSPERFVNQALEALPAARFGARLAEATRLQRLASSGRAEAAAAVQGLLDLWASLGGDEAVQGPPVALLLDEATEIRSLAYFTGLREVARPFGAALVARRRGTLAATSYPTLARRLWPSLGTLEVPALLAAELTPLIEERRLPVEPEALVRACAGRPRYLRLLLPDLERGLELPDLWAESMAPGGPLEQACRHTYETLLLRSRGYGMSKAVLATVAEEEGLNLTALVARLGRTPGAVRDYLAWLVGVDALRFEGKRYFYVDPMVRSWVRLHARGAPPDEAALRAAARQVIGPDAEDTMAVPIPAADREAVAVTRSRTDSLIEID